MKLAAKLTFIFCLAVSALFFLRPSLLLADAGILIPSNRQQPDPKILSLAEMAVDIWIDNGNARVLVRQIFRSHNSTRLEGTYLFALPDRSTVSDFAVWDGVTRIPGVILERKRAQEIYEELRQQMIDPGLLQVGERGAAEARRASIFNVKVHPIPAYGSKRIEIEYYQRVPVEELKSYFALPLRPDAYHAQQAGRLWITLELRSKHALRDFTVISKAYPIEIRERTPHFVKATFEGRNVSLSEDFAVQYAFGDTGAKKDAVEVLTHRDPRRRTPSAGEKALPADRAQPGFFQVSTLLAPVKSASTAVGGPPRNIVLLFDNSLSMQWEKLERSFQALETLLRSLGPRDRFNVLLFNEEVERFAPKPVAADASAADKALEFVRGSRLRRGTNLQRALGQAIRQAGTFGRNSHLIVLSDGGATRGSVQNGRLAAWFEKQWSRLPEGGRPRTYIFAVGDDANMPLMRLLSRNNGVLEWVRSTEPIEFKLNAFLSKIGRNPLEALKMRAAPQSNFDLIYPLEETWFPGSIASWVGQYLKPAAKAQFSIQGWREGKPVTASKEVPLPAEDLKHPHLPRLWARARVDALLEKIEREGEDRVTVDEIIRLARKYKFVTPYTSFLAAPRSLLRPRVIRPGDPLLRVKTDPAIVSVVALFPFGLVKPLRYLPQEDTWQTRFLAPPDMDDGTHQVRLLLCDKNGQTYRESKSFVIISKPPVVRVRLEKERFQRGETVRLRVSATKNTRTLTARMYGALPANLRWNQKAGYNTGEIRIPAHLPAGKYSLTVTAEDFAHNIGTEEVVIEIVP